MPRRKTKPEYGVGSAYSFQLSIVGVLALRVGEMGEMGDGTALPRLGPASGKKKGWCLASGDVRFYPDPAADVWLNSRMSGPVT
jgi:hypothetical protein